MAAAMIQVHDEILVVAKNEYAQDLANEVKSAMVSVLELDVPLDADVRVCQNWAEGH